MNLLTVSRRVLPTLLLAALLSACATRTRRSTLGNAWQATEPQMDMGRYENVQKRPGQRGDIAVAVAISGGGMRAANFAAGVLQALEKIPVKGADGGVSNLLREVDYFSTASGGGLAAVSYVLHLAEYQQRHPEDPMAKEFRFGPKREGDSMEDPSGRNWRDALSRNYQASMIRALFNPIMMGSMNRGDVLERRLDDNVVGEINGRTPTLGDIFVPRGQTPRLPYWVANATVFENGAIFPFTPDILEKYGITGYWHRETYRDLPAGGAAELPLSVGLKASASFPVAIPPSNLKSCIDKENSSLHLMDGGVADNLGVITATRLLNQDPARKKVLIVIDAYNGTTEPFSKGGVAPGIMSSALRTASISLDSAHQRVDNLLSLVATTSGVKVAVVDFHRALREQAEEKERIEAAGGEVSGRASRFVAKKDRTSPQSIDALFTQVLGMGTWFKIKKEDQETLLKAGENAVYRQRGENTNAEPQLLRELEAITGLF